MESLYFEDFRIGDTLTTASRTLTDADIDAFAAVSGDRNPLHMDEAYARASIFGGRVAHGLLGLAMVSGLLNQSRLTAGTLEAFLGLEWSFRRPLRPGDTVRASVRVTGRREVSAGHRGIVKLSLSLLDERDEVVQEGRFTLMVKKRPPVEP